MRVGDRVVNKLNGKHGTLTSIVRPVQVGSYPTILLRMDRDEGGYDLEEEHNYVLEDKFEKGKTATWENEIEQENKDFATLSPETVIPDNSTDAIDGLTPIEDKAETVETTKPKKTKKTENKTEEAFTDILNSVE